MIMMTCLNSITHEQGEIRWVILYTSLNYYSYLCCSVLWLMVQAFLTLKFLVNLAPLNTLNIAS